MPALEEPIQPPCIVDARKAIEKELADHGAKSQALAGLIQTWQVAIRTWQDSDSLHQAFVQGRLTYRTLTHEGSHYNYEAKDDRTKRILGIINNDNYINSLKDGAVKSTNPKAGGYVKGALLAENKDYRMNVGGAGMKHMQDPANYIKKGPHRLSNQFNMGLVDVSMHLLDPRSYVVKGYWSMTLIVLLPLPLPTDVSLFYELRRIAKTEGSEVLRTAMATMATQFIRPRLASSLDMGTQYVYKPGVGAHPGSVKYVKGEGAGVTSKETPDQCRLNVIDNYRQILVENPTGANEITVAIRKYGNTNRFPSFAVCAKKGAKTLDEINIQLAKPDSGAFATYEATAHKINLGDFTIVQV